MDKMTESINQVKSLCEKAKTASLEYKKFSQSQVDYIFQQAAEAAFGESERLARLAVTDTGFGKFEDKIIKNQFASKNVYEAYKDWKTVGVIDKNPRKNIIEIAAPVGVVAGLIPSTNPTSTAVYKALLCLKSGNALVCSPHPKAVKCIFEAIEVVRIAAENAGAPKNLISSITIPTMEAINELFKNENVGLILATGGKPMVKAAYSSGKPAYGVGPGNVPAFIERTANIRLAVSDIVKSKTFDYGTICASEQAIVTETVIEKQVESALLNEGAYFVREHEQRLLEKLMVPEPNKLNPEIVGQPAVWLAQKSGFSVPPNTKVLVAKLNGVGKDFPLSLEKLSPVLAFYVESDWHKACERCIEILNYGGIGHTLSIHSENPEVILQFGLEKPAYRIVVNSPSTHGAIGLTTGVYPAMTLGPGTSGGAITSDNITPRHLINVKRLAFDTSRELPVGMFDYEPVHAEKGIYGKGKLTASQVEKIRFDFMEKMGFLNN
ncbi:aldehyde dehydrogenase family protein [bacterium]|nr:aldehyde dehydrogenase family protein [bacterium]